MKIIYMKDMCLKKKSIHVSINKKRCYMIIYIILILLGFFLLIKGADFLVDGASNIAKKFHFVKISNLKF